MNLNGLLAKQRWPILIALGAVLMVLVGVGDYFASSALLEFGPFTFDKSLGKLSKHGTTIRLRGMPLKILHHLVEHPGEVVSRGELQHLL